ncbi:MAG: hypothetical protein ABSG43_01820 [Solirubrobacteraceae bacterium]
MAAGTRSVQQLKQVITAVEMTPIVEAVNIPFDTQFIGEDGSLNPNEVIRPLT